MVSGDIFRDGRALYVGMYTYFQKYSQIHKCIHVHLYTDIHIQWTWYQLMFSAKDALCT